MLVNPSLQQMLDELIDAFPSGTDNITASDFRNYLTPLVIKAWQDAENAAPSEPTKIFVEATTGVADSLGAVTGDLYIGPDGKLSRKNNVNKWVFLVDLKGTKGDTGRGLDGQNGKDSTVPGPPGKNGRDGRDGKDGATLPPLPALKPEPGKDGLNGKSAYELWLAQGNVGTLNQFLNQYRGDTPEAGVGAIGLGSVTNDMLATDVKVGSLSAAVNAFPADAQANLTSVEKMLVWLASKLLDVISRVSSLERLNGVGNGTADLVDIDFIQFSQQDIQNVSIDANWNTFGFYTGPLIETPPYHRYVKLPTETAHGYQYETWPVNGSTNAGVFRTQL